MSIGSALTLLLRTLKHMSGEDLHRLEVLMSLNIFVIYYYPRDLEENR